MLPSVFNKHAKYFCTYLVNYKRSIVTSESSKKMLQYGITIL
jgi:hypothetical protein